MLSFCSPKKGGELEYPPSLQPDWRFISSLGLEASFSAQGLKLSQ
jgi:hypothetical protein